MLFPTPDQVEGGVKDTVYQTERIAHAVIPDTSGIAFKGSSAIPVLRPEWRKACLSVISHPIELGMTL